MRAQLARDFERFGGGLPRDFAGHIREAYRIDLAARYLGFPIPHPIGKGSGQLSLSQEQLENDRAAGQDGDRRGLGRHPRDGRVGHSRDQDEGRDRPLGVGARRLDGDLEG
jgi:hypothetical protein